MDWVEYTRVTCASFIIILIIIIIIGPLRPDITVRYIAVSLIFFNSGLSLKTDVCLFISIFVFVSIYLSVYIYIHLLLFIYRSLLVLLLE